MRKGFHVTTHVTTPRAAQDKGIRVRVRVRAKAKVRVRARVRGAYAACNCLTVSLSKRPKEAHFALQEYAFFCMLARDVRVSGQLAQCPTEHTEVSRQVSPSP